MQFTQSILSWASIFSIQRASNKQGSSFKQSFWVSISIQPNSSNHFFFSG